MNKLIKLLDEYTHADFIKHEDGCFKEKYMGEEGRWDSDTEVISKEYGFIKRLVENDKIDRDKFNYCRDNFFDTRYYGFSTHEYILMLLSIRDNPIELLISILR